jgi:hypothetical protein
MTATLLPTIHAGHIILWLWPKTLLNKILMRKPHRDLHLTYNTQDLFDSYLASNNLTSIDIYTFNRVWPGTPNKAMIRGLRTQAQAADPSPSLTLKAEMWQRIRTDFIPSNKPTYSACAPPDRNKPSSTMLATAHSRNHLISSTIPI